MQKPHLKYLLPTKVKKYIASRGSRSHGSVFVNWGFLFFFPLQQQEAPRFLAHFKGKFIIHKVQGPHIKLFSFTFGFILIKKIKREKQKPSNSLVVCSLFSNLLFLLKCVAQICSSYSQRWLFLRGQKGIRSYSYLKRPFCVNRERERNKTKGRKAKPNYTTSVQVEEYWPRE